MAIASMTCSRETVYRSQPKRIGALPLTTVRRNGARYDGPRRRTCQEVSDGTQTVLSNVSDGVICDRPARPHRSGTASAA